MGKNLPQQRRGKGKGPRWRAPSHRYRGEVSYRPLERNESSGIVLEIMHDPGRNSPLALVKFEDGEKRLMIAPDGLKIGDEILCGKEVPVEFGNVVALGRVPEGVPVFNLEKIPGDGGRFARSSGSYGFIVSKTGSRVVVKMPSGKVQEFDFSCRATVGIPAGVGRVDKPFYKAGYKHFAMRARGRHWPFTSASKRNPVDHPFGGSTRPGTHKTVSRRKPPGAKVGSISARRTGKRK